MTIQRPISRFLLFIIILCVSRSAMHGQQPAEIAPATIAPSADPAKPLPDIPTLMRAVEANQRTAEAIEKNYLYHSVEIRQETDSHGQPKKTEHLEFDYSWIDGIPIRRLVKKDGQPLSPDEARKESERIDKHVASDKEKHAKADAKGKDTDAAGHDEVSVSRILELGAFTNPRRVSLNGRDTIAVDYQGDPKAKTRNRAEEVIRDMQGTVWVDESDRILTRAEGHFVNSFKIGGGLLVNIQKGTHFSFQQAKINQEVWLPSQIDAAGSARAMLFFSFNGNVHITDSDYRKFRTTSTILPANTPAESQASPQTN